MSISTPLLGLGLVMAGLGTILLLLSCNSRGERDDAEFRSAGVICLGPIPIAFGGVSKWSMVGIAVAVMILLFVAAAMAQPEIISL